MMIGHWTVRRLWLSPGHRMHAVIKHIDISVRVAMPGVLTVLTGEDYGPDSLTIHYLAHFHQPNMI